MKKIMIRVVLFLLLFISMSYYLRLDSYAAYANVEITVKTVDDANESKVDVIFCQNGVYKNTGFVGGKDGVTKMIQVDEGSVLRIVVYPKHVDGDVYWKADERFFSGLPYEYEEKPVVANYVDMQIPAGGSFCIENQSEKSKKPRIYITKTYSGYGSAKVTGIFLGDHQMNMNEINGMAGDYLRDDSAIPDVDHVVEQYASVPVTQEVSEMTERLINGTATNTDDERIWNLENQLRIVRDERDTIQSDYDNLRDALGTDGQINALNTHVDEVQARDQLLLNENAALSLAIQSKDNTIKALQDEIDRLRAELDAALANAYVPPEEEHVEEPLVFSVIREEEPVVEEPVVSMVDIQSIPKPQKLYLLDRKTLVWLIVALIIVSGIAGMVAYFMFTKRGRDVWYEIKKNTLWRL